MDGYVISSLLPVNDFAKNISYNCLYIMHEYICVMTSLKWNDWVKCVPVSLTVIGIVKIALQGDCNTFILSPGMYAGEFSHILTNNL